MRQANRQHLTSYGRLNGSTTYATIPAAFSLETVGRSRLSGGLWFYYDGNASFITAQTPHMLGIRCATGVAACLQLGLLGPGTAPNNLQIGTDEGSATQNFQASVNILTRGWNHWYAAVDLETGLVRQWYNGVLVSSAIGTFDATTFASGAGALSYIGSNSVGSAITQGYLRDIVVSFAPITDDIVWDLFSAGDVPQDSYHWPCDDSRGTVLACYKDNAPYPIYDATLVGGSNFFSRNVPVPVRVVDSCNRYVFLDGVADYYFTADDLTAPAMLGAPVLMQAGWCYLDRIPSNTVSAMFVPEGGGVTALTFNILNTGLMSTAARSRNGGFASGLAPPANHWANKAFLREWFHYIQEVDYAGKTHKFWINGSLVGSLTAVAWEDLSYQGTPGAGVINIGANAGFWPGKLGEQYLGRRDYPLTDSEALGWYAASTLPAEMQTIFHFGLPDGIAPRDLGPYAVTINPTSIVAPYGVQSNLFGGPGR